MTVSHVLAEETIGFEPIADGLWEVYSRTVKLGRFDERRVVSTMSRGASRANGAADNFECQPCLRINPSRMSPTLHFARSVLFVQALVSRTY